MNIEFLLDNLDKFYDFEQDFVISSKKKNHYDIFNFNKTVAHPDFVKYYKNRNKLPNTPYKNFSAIYGPDLVRHFELAFQVLGVLYEDMKNDIDSDL
tara:strand:- start:283 stop:573 length:291 start_codon:yes stop_codon:yes gene_type:complete